MFAYMEDTLKRINLYHEFRERWGFPHWLAKILSKKLAPVD